jgi:hypothetical protein
MKVSVPPSYIPLMGAHSQLHARDVQDVPLWGGWRLLTSVWKDDGPIFDARRRYRDIPWSCVYHVTTNWTRLATDLFYWLEAQKQTNPA